MRKTIRRNIKRDIQASDKKEYMKQYSQLYYQENKTGKLQDSADRYSKNREHLLDLRHQRYLRQREEQSKKSHKLYYDVKIEIFTLLGNKCANPYNLPHPNWCNEKECLQIDHIYGGGVKELKNFSNAYERYRFILRQIKNGSKDYQLLCANCNQKKRYKNGEGIKLRTL